MNAYLDLGALVARLVLAALSAATVVFLGLWLREGNALGFAATFTSVALSWYLVNALRGRRLSAPTAAAARLQPIVDALGDFPGGKVFASSEFKRIMVALGVGLAVAGAEQLLSSTLLAAVPLPPLWRGLIALGLILLPVSIAMEWLVSRQSYAGTRFAARMLDAIWQVIHPGADPSTTPWADVSTRARVVGFGVARTVATLGARVVAQVLIPVIFASWMGIGFVVALVVTTIAGWPLFAHAGRSLRKRSTTEREIR